MAEKNIIEQVGALRFIAELVSMYGAKRGAGLVGYAILWGAADLQSREEARLYLQRLGLSQASAYRVVADFGHFLHHLETEYGRPVAWSDALREIQQEASQN